MRNGRLLASYQAAALVIAAIGLFTVVSSGRPSPAAPAKLPLTLRHCTPWFEAPPDSARWGWRWTKISLDPDEVMDGRRRIASHCCPLIGRYDFGSPALTEYPLVSMELGGIDGVIGHWSHPPGQESSGKASRRRILHRTICQQNALEALAPRPLPPTRPS